MHYLGCGKVFMTENCEKSSFLIPTPKSFSQIRELFLTTKTTILSISSIYLPGLWCDLCNAHYLWTVRCTKSDWSTDVRVSRNIVSMTAHFRVSSLFTIADSCPVGSPEPAPGSRRQRQSPKLSRYFSPHRLSSPSLCILSEGPSLRCSPFVPCFTYAIP